MRSVLVVRTYKICVVKTIVDCINQNRGNCYIWHMTGSVEENTKTLVRSLLSTDYSI